MTRCNGRVTGVERVILNERARAVVELFAWFPRVEKRRRLEQLNGALPLTMRRVALRCGGVLTKARENAWALVLIGSFSIGSQGCGPSTSPVLTRAEPNTVMHGEETSVKLSGRNLSNSLRVDLDSRQSAVANSRWSVRIGELNIDSENVRLLDSHTLSVIVPPTLTLGPHDVAVTTPAGALATLSDGLTVVDAGAATAEPSAAPSLVEPASTTNASSPVVTGATGDSVTSQTGDGLSSGPPTNGSPDAAAEGSTSRANTSEVGVDALRAALVHRYSFEHAGTTVLDSVGGADGTFIGGALDGVSGAARFTGGAEYIDLPNALISGRDAVTIEVWMTWEAPDSGPTYSWQRVFDFGSSTGAEGLQGSQDTHLFLSPRSGGPAGALHLAYRGNLTGSVTLNASAPLAPAVIEHVTAVVDGAGGHMELYVNGISTASRALGFPLSLIDDHNNWIGRSQVLEDPAFLGRIFEFRIYDAALSPQNVGVSYAAGPDAAL